jgi:hypothetical protein
MSISIPHKVSCDVEGCSSVAEVDVLLEDSIYRSLPEGWVTWSSEEALRIRCGDEGCVTAASAIKEEERLVRAARVNPKPSEEEE